MELRIADVSSKPPVLGDLEVAVLEDLWLHGVGDAKSVHSRISAARAISLNTVQSTLERLYRKQVLNRNKVSHAFRYTPAVDRSTLVGQLIEGVASRVGGGERDVLLAAFVDIASRAGEDSLRELESLVAAQRASTDKPSP